MEGILACGKNTTFTGVFSESRLDCLQRSFGAERGGDGMSEDWLNGIEKGITSPF
jgi:hypothetical protein